MPRSVDAIGDSATRVLLAVLDESRPTCRSVGSRAGSSSSSSSSSTVHAHLVTLRRLGLVRWDTGKRGTLRAGCRAVPFGAVADIPASEAINVQGLTAFPSPVTAFMPIVQGVCPSCGARSLFLAVGGYVTCASLSCQDPCAASKALGDEDP